MHFAWLKAEAGDLFDFALFHSSPTMRMEINTDQK